MAYKFQLGAAKLGGAITSSGTISGSIVDSQGAVSGSSIKLTDASGLAGTALENSSGALTISSAGVTNTMLSGGIEGAKLANGAVGNTQLSGNISADKLNLGGTVESSTGELDVKFGAGSGLDADGSGLKIAAGGITDTMLSGAIELSKLETITAADIIVGDGSGVPTAVAMSGDISITSAGSTSIGSGKVTNAMLSGAVELSKLETVTAANIIVANGSGVPSAVAMSGDISITSLGATSIGSGKVTNTMLSGNITADKLATGDGLQENAGALEVSLNTSSGLEFSGGKLQVDLSSSNALALDAGGLDLKSTIAGSRTFSNDVTVNGNFTVLGSTFSASVGTLQIEDALISIGDGQASFAQDYGIEFGSSGSAWASLKTDSDAGFNNLSSSLPLLAPSLATNEWSITSTHISGNLPVSASAFYGDGSNLTGISADSATSLRLAGANAIVNSNITASNDVNLVDTSGARTIEMPDINSNTVGRVYIIKDIVGSAATNNITINDSTSGHDIDGETSITIESDFGAVNLLAVSGAAGFSYIIF